MSFDYSSLWISKLSLLTYFFLSLAVLSLWIKRAYFVWGSLFSIALLAGILDHRLQWLALLFIIFFGSVVYLTFHAPHIKFKIISGIIVFILSILVILHKIPGFSNWQIIKALPLSPEAIPYSLYLNFDKPLIGLFILGFGTLPLLKKSKECFLVVQQTLPLAVIGILTILAVTYSVGYVKFDLKLYSFFFLWAFNNLVLMCIAEEAFFRGFVQHYLSIAFKKIYGGKYLAILFASLIFGAVHTGSIQYMLLASLAGILYGLVYQRTKSIEASIVTHFLLNSVHFLFLTYPALAPGLS